ncbi:MAG: hypothetical protein ACRDWD_15380 [Acidimicrobiia bacterium]
MRRAILVAAVAGLGLAHASPAASRHSPYSAIDPKDTAAKADIRSYRVAYGDTIKLDVRLRKGTDPFNGPQWQDRLTGVLWLIDVPGGDALPEYAAFFYNGGPGVLDGEVDLFEPPHYDTKISETTETFHDGNGYRLEFDPSAIGNPAFIRVQASMVLDNLPSDLDDDLPGEEDKIDFAPDVLFEFTPKIKRAGS